ncbi:MAG: carboxylesterase family protein [Rhizomicrobium sp.]
MRALIVLVMLLSAAPALAAPTVAIDQGTLAGVSDNGIDIYKAVPYAAPPTGDLRWRAPRPAPHWTSTRDATVFGPACPQHPTEALLIRANLPQSEDCLTLNVWTPEPRGAKLPVMLWIHGGGFTEGAASVPRFDGAALARHGVVLVTINYRLGRLGFFAYPGLEEVNFGLLDQIAALQWVERNIAAFGGDPANVTVFGESAGGASVDALMVSPLARGLFAKAISESGGLFKTDTLAEARASAQAFAAKLNATGPDALTTLRALGADRIVSDDESGPILDGHVLTEEIVDAFAAGHMAKIPYLAGSNSNEGNQIGDGPADWLTQPFGDRLAAVRALYEKDGKLDDGEFHRQIFSDRFMAGPAALAAGAVSRAGAPAYVYRFAFLADLARRRGLTGVPHGGEMIFVFGFGPLAVFAPPQDTAISQTMQSYWTNFARTGDPNGAGLPPWPKFEGAAPPTLVIDDQPHAVPDFRKAQFEAVNPARTPAP